MKLGKVNLSQDWSSPVKTGQVRHNFFRLKFLLDKNFMGTFYWIQIALENGV